MVAIWMRCAVGKLHCASANTMDATHMNAYFMTWIQTLVGLVSYDDKLVARKVWKSFK